MKTDEEKVKDVVAVLTGEFYVGQRVQTERGTITGSVISIGALMIHVQTDDGLQLFYFRSSLRPL